MLISNGREMRRESVKIDVNVVAKGRVVSRIRGGETDTLRKTLISNYKSKTLRRREARGKDAVVINRKTHSQKTQ